MFRKLKIIYYVEPNTAALARRAAQYFVEMVDEAVGRAGTGADRDQRRLDAEGGISSCWATQASRGGDGCHGTSWSFTGWMSGAFRRTTRRATTG